MTRFMLGQVVITPGALEAVPSVALAQALNRHKRGDWGDIHEGDQGLNELALEHGDRLLSVYHDGEVKFWIITEGAEEAGEYAITTILLPDEY